MPFFTLFLAVLGLLVPISFLHSRFQSQNAQGEEYGEERLVEVVSNVEGFSATQTQEAILSDVNAFLAGTAPQDDITLVVLRVGDA